MQIYYSTLCVLGLRLSEQLDEMIAEGSDAIELILDGGEWNEFRSRRKELADLLAGKHAVYSVHPPVWDMNLTSENAEAREAALQACRESISFAAQINASHVVIHPGFCYASIFDKQVARERAAQGVETLCQFNAPYGVQLLIENVGTPATSIFTGEEYISFVEGFGGKVGSLMDIGHAHLCGWDIIGVISRLKPFLYAVHLHDNGGSLDSHLPIGKGSIPWDPIFRVLRGCRPELRLILEYDIGTPAEELKAGNEILRQAFSLSPNECRRSE